MTWCAAIHQRLHIHNTALFMLHAGGAELYWTLGSSEGCESGSKELAQQLARCVVVGGVASSVAGTRNSTAWLAGSTLIGWPTTTWLIKSSGWTVPCRTLVPCLVYAGPFVVAGRFLTCSCSLPECTGWMESIQPRGRSCLRCALRRHHCAGRPCPATCMQPTGREASQQ